MSADDSESRAGTDDAPSTRDLARRLGVDGQLLKRFAREHPNLTPPILLGWAGADPKHRDAVETWLAQLSDGGGI